MRKLLLIAILFYTGANCLTNIQTKAIKEYANARREFDTSIVEGHVRMARGVVYREGTRVIAVFPDTLQGSGRLLRFEGSAGALRLVEGGKLSGDAPALILRQNVCCMEDVALNAVLFSDPGTRITIDTIVREKFGLKDAPSAGTLGVIDFTNVYTVSAYLLVSENGAIKSVDALPPGDYEKAMAEIDWHVRSRPVYIGMHLWYGVTVPLDIITSPLQLLAALLMPVGAK